MTLSDLKTALVNAATDSLVYTVLFAYEEYIQYAEKTYPLILWDFGKMTELFNRRDNKSVYTIDCYCIVEVTPEDDEQERMVYTFDKAKEAIESYLDYVVQQDNITIENEANTKVEYYEAGMFSVDREMGIKYVIELKTWC